MNPECPSCGLEIDPPSLSHCPKCEAPVRARTNGRLHQVDVAHNGEDLDMALRKLERAIDASIRGNFRGVKVIHGHGASTGRGRLKPHIVAAMRRAAAHFGAKVVPDRHNPGAHLIWFE